LSPLTEALFLCLNSLFCGPETRSLADTVSSFVIAGRWKVADSNGLAGRAS
jgi:hypothetical protein